MIDQVDIAFGADVSGVKQGAAEAAQAIQESAQAIASTLSRMASDVAATLRELQTQARSAVDGASSGLLEHERDFLRDSEETEREMAQDSREQSEEDAREVIKRARNLMSAKFEIAREEARRELDIERERVRHEREIGGITEREAIERVRRIEAAEYSVERDTLDAKKSLRDTELKERQKIDRQIEELQRGHALAVRRIDDEAALAVKRQWDRILGAVNSAFNRSIRGLIQGTLTLRRAMANIGQAIVAEFVNMGVRLVTSWISTEIAKTAATTTGNAARTASNIAAATASGAAEKSAAQESIVTHAASAAAAVYDDVAQIPYVGWILAPAAAAAAFIAVAAFGNAIPSAAGGYDVPADTFAYLHKDEMVLPSTLAERVRALTEPRRSAHGGPAIGQVVIHATDADSFRRMLRRNPQAIADAMLAAHRSFRPMKT